MSMLQNAIQAIECGIEDFGIGGDARLKSAVRNMHAGILLLLKEKLVRLSPKDTDEVLIKARVVPKLVKRKIIWKGSGKKTINSAVLKDRFNKLNIKFNWEMFNEVASIRNDIEHYFTAANILTIQGAISKSFVLMRDFMLTELVMDPQKCINKKLWAKLIEINDFYNAEKIACEQTKSHFDCKSSHLKSNVYQSTCTNCGSDLIRFKIGGLSECRACSKKFDKYQTITNLIENVYGFKNYLAMKEGCEPCTVSCPECKKDTFIVKDMICALCGVSQVAECSRCSGSLSADEIGEEMCGYCRYQVAKDD